MLEEKEQRQGESTGKALPFPTKAAGEKEKEWTEQKRKEKGTARG